MRFLQTFHIEAQNKVDINYNFVVGGDGNVYMGRGWNSRCENADDFDGLIVGFICPMEPTESQRKVAQQLLANGIELDILERDFQLIDKLKKY